MRMKFKSAITGLTFILGMFLLSSCDSGSSSVDSFSLECLSIAGAYNAPIQFQGTNIKENMAISIEADCDFAAKSPTTGESFGKLTSAGGSTYYGTGRSSACPSGKFSVSLNGTSYTGIRFATQCI